MNKEERLIKGGRHFRDAMYLRRVANYLDGIFKLIIKIIVFSVKR